MQSMGYRQLTQIQRYQIHARYDLGMSQRQIGRELGLHSSTISRELPATRPPMAMIPSRLRLSVTIGAVPPGSGQSACRA